MPALLKVGSIDGLPVPPSFSFKRALVHLSVGNRLPFGQCAGVRKVCGVCTMDFRENLISAGVTPRLADKLTSDGIDDQQFQIIDTDFMRNVLALSGGEIFQVLTARPKMRASAETVEAEEAGSDGQASQETLPLSDQGSALDHVSEEDKLPENDALSQFIDIGEFSDYELINMRAKMERYNRAIQSGLPKASKIMPDFMKTKPVPKISCDVPCHAKRQLEQDNRDPDSDASIDVEAEDESSGPSRKDLERAFDSFIPETEPEFGTLHGSLPKFDVIKILKAQMLESPVGIRTKVMRLLEKKHLERTERLCIIRALTRHLYKFHVTDPSEVTSKMKDGMAKSFCVTFPKFANMEDKIRPWSTAFNPKGPSGWIASASRAFMREIAKDAPKKKRKSNISSAGPAYNLDDVKALSLINPGRAEKTEILDGMEKCFEMRQEERNNGESIAFFLRKYPQFLNYEGEVLSEEFKRMYSKAEDGCKAFLLLQTKILQLRAKRDLDLPIQDDILKALLLLSQNLPHDIPSKNDKKKGFSKTWAEFKDLVIVLKLADDVEKYIEQRINRSKTTIQPYLILIRGQVEATRILKSFLILDGKPIELQTVNVLKSFDWLFKSYYVFNVCFPLGWRTTLHFIQTCMYKFFETGRKDTVTSSEFELLQSLTS
ncbi:hypothetical protein ONE63_000040 [Megalurothrips usitatus]|uniref:Uncharacterized protein n=1 Tax=Megalurothrips usitatus TaxID=439358 RepID=A0AAV7XX89_9NEOP|nr:hypothetical protein ONE63_000040 [Megalurothrips usitatus]